MIKELNKNIIINNNINDNVKKFSYIDYKFDDRELNISLNDIEYYILREIRNYLNSNNDNNDYELELL